MGFRIQITRVAQLMGGPADLVGCKLLTEISDSVHVLSQLYSCHSNHHDSRLFSSNLMHSLNL
jgi:hypothetical protein